MKKTKLSINLVLLLLVGLTTVSCVQSKFIVAPPFTNVEKISNIETGQSKDDVNKELGIQPYDLLYLNNGDFLCYYNYRLVGRRVNIDNSRKNQEKGSDHMSSNKAQTNGEPFYTEWRKVYINFKDGKVTHYTTDTGLRNSSYIQLVNGMIKLLNKEDLKLENFHERNNGSGVNINTEGPSEACCTESIDIDKILFQLKRNGEFKDDKKKKSARKKSSFSFENLKK